MLSITISTSLLSARGNFHVFFHKFQGEECVSFSMGDVSVGVPIVRVHSSCLFGEVFHSSECDCGLQLEASIRLIEKEEKGVVVYLFQEGRGVGLEGKMASMELEKTEHIDNVSAFTRLYHQPDLRSYNIAIQALKDLNVSKKIRVITNNPEKINAFESGGFEVLERITLNYEVTEETYHYLLAKSRLLGHIIDFSKIKKKIGHNHLNHKQPNAYRIIVEDEK